jgi:hypothetical protein
MYGLELFAMQYPFMGSNAQFLQRSCPAAQIAFPSKIGTLHAQKISDDILSS